MYLAHNTSLKGLQAVKINTEIKAHKAQAHLVKKNIKQDRFLLNCF